jgi:hypothetical protein
LVLGQEYHHGEYRMIETQKGAVNQLCAQLPATLERVMTSKDYQYNMQLLGSGRLDEPVFALVDVVARIAAADVHSYAFLDDTEATSVESLLTRSSEDPMGHGATERAVTPITHVAA